ncbi:MAG: RNA-binding transcriptional accessory protein [Bdellovibrionales bacterium CG10_big_fil_rev_8_21_14_0_10_45_34]|nr:MAG: RNA-binding transcriptional accessory protein [Bdellovibrionales bacterium CG10_big_fil_rev_8_21_14_0_10_45_34]
MGLNWISFFNEQCPGIPESAVKAVLGLVQDGATVPFIARYRKEKTGNLDEVQVQAVIDLHATFEEVIKRQAYILKEIESQGNLNENLKKLILETKSLGELEEIYRPYKKKKKTKATLAREAGIEPFADWLLSICRAEQTDSLSVDIKAREFTNAAKGFLTYDMVIKGAQDIVGEKVSIDPELRAWLLADVLEYGKIQSRAGKKYKANSKFEMYQEFEEPIKKLFEEKASHRYLAMRRGWQESELTVTILLRDEEGVEAKFQNWASPAPAASDSAICQMCKGLVREAAKSAFQLSVLPSVTNEVHRRLKDQADEHAIRVFSENVRKLLLASPFGPRCVLGVDPGVRTGAKVALVDKGGNYLSHTVMHFLGEQVEGTKKMLGELFATIPVDAIGVGNGTAGRETEAAVRKIVQELGLTIPVVLVNESGASIYSASEVAREEFPNLDLTVRGAISIARRLQDPLAELVKIDPKSIGVGQYQHDVSQPRLKKSLDFIVQSCVNHVGVNLNTASSYLLQYVSGIGPQLAQQIVGHRKEKGLFKSRDELLSVPKFSSKAFEQGAGFLRVLESDNVLDRTGIHPERYGAVRDMAQTLGLTLSQLASLDGISKLKEEKAKFAPLIGEFTFVDIVSELEKPGRDPRDPYKVFTFREDIHELKDLKEGMLCPGIVTNVTNFGAFVDIGVHQDGLAHISELTHKFVDDPKLVVSPGDQVQVKVLKVDLDKKQIALTMKLTDPPARSPGQTRSPHNRAGGSESRETRPRRRPENSEAPQRSGDGDSRSANRPARRDRNGESGGDARRFSGRSGSERPQGRRGDAPKEGSTQKGGGAKFRDEKGRSGDRQKNFGGKDGSKAQPRREGGKPFNNSFADLASLLKRN